MASAVAAAESHLWYSILPGSSRWSSSNRYPCSQRSVSNAGTCGSDHALVAAIDRELRPRGLGEGGTAHLGGELRYVAARHLRAKHVVPLVVVHAHPILPCTRLQNLVGPDRRVEYLVWMQNVDTNAVGTPFQR